MMRILLIAALLMTPAGVAASPPVLDLASSQGAQMGTFAGLRLRVPLGGPPRERQVRATATIAPTLHAEDQTGARSMRMGEGVEFSFRADGRPSFSLAGEDLTRRYGAKLNANDEDDGGIPTWALVVGGLAVTAGIGYLALIEALDCDSGSECN